MREKQALCRDCFATLYGEKRCPKCHSPRILYHKELFCLNIAHVDCDAFYASIEKSMNEELVDKPLIVGGGSRGIVTTCCYIARISGVKSAMPVYIAKKLCPRAIIVPPRMSLYRKISRLIYSKMTRLTPKVETIALDEAYLDLSGTKQLHGKTPAELLVELAKEIENEVNLSISIGLSENRFLAKLASSLNKPRAFTVIGKEEKHDFIRNLPVTSIPGVGPKLSKKLKKNSIEKISQLVALGQNRLEKQYGTYGKTLWNFARGEDSKIVEPNSIRKSISKEITFEADLKKETDLKRALWLLSEKVSDELKSKRICGRTITLKLKRSDFKVVSMSYTADQPFKMAEELYQSSLALLVKKLFLAPFRLLGLSISRLIIDEEDGGFEKSFDTTYIKIKKTELAMDKIRSKFGKKSIIKGRSF
jgi:DNA polymerase-4